MDKAPKVWLAKGLVSRTRSIVKIKISEKLFWEKENSPLLKPQEKVFHRFGYNIPPKRDFVTLNKSVINYIPRCTYHLLYIFIFTTLQGSFLVGVICKFWPAKGCCAPCLLVVILFLHFLLFCLIWSKRGKSVYYEKINSKALVDS